MPDSTDNLSPQTHPSGRVTTADVYAVVERVESRLVSRIDALDARIAAHMLLQDAKVDAIDTRLDRLEGRLQGSLEMVKWLGPVGLAAIAIGLIRGLGLV